MYVFSVLCAGNPSIVQSNYSSAVASTRPICCRGGSFSLSLNFFEAININVTTTGYYDMRSRSTMKSYGYLYDNSFDPIFPGLNLLKANENNRRTQLFLLSMLLQAGTSYILVATTDEPYATGTFSILATGPASVWFSPINITGG
jgi:hypothetical protein